MSHVNLFCRESIFSGSKIKIFFVKMLCNKTDKNDWIFNQLATVWKICICWYTFLSNWMTIIITKLSHYYFKTIKLMHLFDKFINAKLKTKIVSAPYQTIWILTTHIFQSFKVTLFNYKPFLALVSFNSVLRTVWTIKISVTTKIAIILAECILPRN